MKKTFYSIALISFFTTGVAQNREPAGTANDSRANSSPQAQDARIGVRPAARPAKEAVPANGAEPVREAQPPREIGTNAPVRPAAGNSNAAPVSQPRTATPENSAARDARARNQAPKVSDDVPATVAPASADKPATVKPAGSESVKPAKVKQKKMNK
jgi:hypothetical protein